MKFIFSFLLLISNVLLFAGSVDYLPVPSNDLVKHTYYTLSYNEKYEQANWVYYTLTDKMVNEGGEERSNKFKMDPMVPSGSAKSSDYTKSGYDRGHLCPAADMGFSPVSMQESFYMSNISPQAPDFNRGIWKELETDVRRWAKKEHKICVVAGPVFKDNKGTIRVDQVLVPGYFFKIIYEETDDPKMIAFVFPNRKSDRPVTDFAVTVDEAEKLTGFDFFSQLPDELENKLESRVDFSEWFDGQVSPQPIATKQLPVTEKTQESVKSDFQFYFVLILVILVVVIFVFIKGRSRR
ncbi:endonuclease [Aquipluma nitroreducens]|uniref:Endonuclease n=1 Tax=Aquipluma nitroreducens TaxID=2010828 RepID=A0A5K7S2Y9_9BACT|nr:DNA/RNA non-specific endonuclease [Aquipluma nitroreducens]BBE15932.1 endonuclease [Aquipluma nitroreducens]